MNNTSKSSASSAQSSSNSNYLTFVTSAQLFHQTEGLIHSLDKRMNGGEVDGVYQSMRTSPGPSHKRPACMLDKEDGESEERIEEAEGELLSARPYTKRSKVDVRYVNVIPFG